MTRHYEIDAELLKENLNTLIDVLKINAADISRFIGYDASYLSKIRNGYRTPSDAASFSKSVVKYIVSFYKSEDILEKLKDVIENIDGDNIYESIYFWLTNNKIIATDDGTIKFLKRLDEFDLNDYIKSIKFDKIKIPTLPKGLPKTKTYYGLQGFKDAQLDYLKQCVLSKGESEIFFYSNMPMIEASKDLDFTKKFMIGVALLLKKGNHINMVHNLDRPFKELLLGLEGWIPLYMTGGISGFYFKNSSNTLYSHIDSVAFNTALSGYSIIGSINSAKFIVTNKSMEYEHYKNNAKLLLKKASPLINIYKSESKDNFYKEYKSIYSLKKDRINYLIDLPIYTISEDLLNHLLDKNNVDEENKKVILSYYETCKCDTVNILNGNPIKDEVYVLSKSEFEACDYKLNLTKIFANIDITYTYEDYLKHIDDTKNFCKKYNNYSFVVRNTSSFKNINIETIGDECAVISKTNKSVIHFVIKYPKLVNAIKNYKDCLIEKSPL